MLCHRHRNGCNCGHIRNGNGCWRSGRLDRGKHRGRGCYGCIQVEFCLGLIRYMEFHMGLDRWALVESLIAVTATLTRVAQGTLFFRDDAGYHRFDRFFVTPLERGCNGAIEAACTAVATTATPTATTSAATTFAWCRLAFVGRCERRSNGSRCRHSLACGCCCLGLIAFGFALLLAGFLLASALATLGPVTVFLDSFAHFIAVTAFLAITSPA